MVMGKKIAATADNAMLYHNVTGVVGNWNRFSIFYKRHSSMVGDVTGRFRIKNLTTSLYERDVAFTATQYWQFYDMERLLPANTNLRVEIVIDNNGDAISLYRATGVQGDHQDHSLRGESTIMHYQRVTMDNVEDYLKAAQGEIEIGFAYDSGSSGNRYLFSSDDVSGTDDPDSRNVRGLLSEGGFDVFTGLGVLHNSSATGVLMNFLNSDENVLIVNWNYNVPFSSGFYTQIYQNGIWYNGANSGWAINGNLLKRLWLGIGNGVTVGTPNSGEGNIAYIRIWENPWRNL
jgi:hypothetical protein